VPLVPAAIAGTDRLSRMQRLEVAYGRPLDTDDLDELGPGDAAPLVTERLREAIEILEHSLGPS
jgi:hypothetical protein